MPRAQRISDAEEEVFTIAEERFDRFIERRRHRPLFTWPNTTRNPVAQRVKFSDFDAVVLQDRTEVTISESLLTSIEVEVRPQRDRTVAVGAGSFRELSKVRIADRSATETKIIRPKHSVLLFPDHPFLKAPS